MVHDRGRDRCGMEHLVEAEIAVRGVGPLEGVHHGAQGVDHAANGDEDDGCGPGPHPECRDFPDDQPSQRQVDEGVEPPWVFDPDEVEGYCGGGADPGGCEDPGCRRWWEGCGADGAVGSGDEDGDGCVVGAAPPLDGGCGFPGAAVVEGGGGECADEAGDVEDGHPGGEAYAVVDGGGGDQGDAGAGECPCGAGVEESACEWAGAAVVEGLLCHGTSVVRKLRLRRVWGILGPISRFLPRRNIFCDNYHLVPLRPRP